MHLPIARRAGGRTRALHRSLIGRLQNDTRPGHLPRKGDGRRLIGGPSKRRGQGDISNRCRPPVCPARAWVRARTVAAGRVSVGEQRRGLFFSRPRPCPLAQRGLRYGSASFWVLLRISYSSVDPNSYQDCRKTFQHLVGQNACRECCPAASGKRHRRARDHVLHTGLCASQSSQRQR